MFSFICNIFSAKSVVMKYSFRKRTIWHSSSYFLAARIFHSEKNTRLYSCLLSPVKLPSFKIKWTGGVYALYPSNDDYIYFDTFRYVGLFVWCFGITGNLLTLLILTTVKQFHSNTYSVFLVVANIIDIFYLLTHLGLFIIDAFLGYSPRSTFTWLCKLTTYFTYFPAYVTITLLAIGSIDRWFSTCRSVRLRSFSSLRNSKIITAVVTIFFALLLIPHPLYTVVYYDPTRNTTKCDRPGGFYKIYTNYMLVLGVHILSILVMIVFGYLTYRNLSAGHRAVRPGGVSMKERINTQMSRTLILQIILFIIFILPNWIITILYTTATANVVNRSAERLAIEAFATNFSMILYDVNFADTFYIFLFISPAFRRNIKLLFQAKLGNNRVTMFAANTQ